MFIGKTVQNCLDFYCEEYVEDQGLTATDNVFYNSLPLYDFFKDKGIQSVNELEIMGYKKWRRRTFKNKRGRDISNNTLGRELTLLRSCLNVAVEYGLVRTAQEKNHIKKLVIKIPKQKTRGAEYIPTIEEAEDIIKALPEHLSKLAFAAHRLGWRKTELCNLTFSMINFDEKIMILPKRLNKNKENRITPLYQEVERFMIQQRDDARVVFGRDNVNDVFVFRNKDGKSPIVPKNVKYHWDKVLVSLRLTEDSKPKYVFHDLRKASIKYLRMRLGFDREMIRIMYTGHKCKKIFDEIYDCVTSEDHQHWIKQALSA